MAMNDAVATTFINVPLAEDRQIEIALFDVESSQISRLGHDPETQTLVVQFAPNARRDQEDGDVYRYGNVDEGLFAAFRNAESIGRFFKTNLRYEVEKHPYAKVRDGKKHDDAAFADSVSAMAGLR